MRSIRNVLFLLIMACALPGCAVYGSYGYDRSIDGWPGYVYIYPDGCWADDLWYSPCPWQPGPYLGYYYFHGGYYYWHQHRHWIYRPGHPPPPAWRSHDPRIHPRFHFRPHRPHHPPRPHRPHHPPRR